MKKYLPTLIGISAFLFSNVSSALEIAAIKEGTVQILFNQAVTQSTTFTIKDLCAFYSAGYIGLQFTLWTRGPGNDAPNITVNIPNVYIGNNSAPNFIANPSTLYLKDSTPVFTSVTYNPVEGSFGFYCGSSFMPVSLTIGLNVDGT